MATSPTPPAPAPVPKAAPKPKYGVRLVVPPGGNEPTMEEKYDLETGEAVKN